MCQQNSIQTRMRLALSTKSRCEQIQVLQQEQKLNPTPTYEIGMDTYLPAIGLIALVVAWLLWQIKAAKPPSKTASSSNTRTNADDL